MLYWLVPWEEPGNEATAHLLCEWTCAYLNANSISSCVKLISSSRENTASVWILEKGRNRLFRLLRPARTTCGGDGRRGEGRGEEGVEGEGEERKEWRGEGRRERSGGGRGGERGGEGEGEEREEGKMWWRES